MLPLDFDLHQPATQLMAAWVSWYLLFPLPWILI